MPRPAEQVRASLVIHRRRRVFVSLLLSAAATLLFGVLPGLHQLLWWHLAFDAALAGFVAKLIKNKKTADQPSVIDDWTIAPSARPVSTEETVIAIPEPILEQVRSSVQDAMSTPVDREEPKVDAPPIDLFGTESDEEEELQDGQLPLLKVSQL